MQNDTTVAHVTAAARIVLDVLRTRPQGQAGGGFMMTTTDPTLMWTMERRLAVQRYSHLVPAGATADDVPQIAARIARLVANDGG